MKKSYLLFLSFLFILFLNNNSFASDKPSFFVTNEVILDGNGTTGVQQITTDLVKMFKISLSQKGFEISNSEFDYSIRFKVETEIDYGLFGAKVAFVKTILIMEKNGIETDTFSFNERTPAGAFMSYGKEGQEYAEKATNFLIKKILQTDYVTKFERKFITLKNDGNRLKTSPSLHNQTPIELTNKNYSGTTRENDLAIVIGIDQYRNLPSSDFSSSDALYVKANLKAIGFEERNIMLLINEKAALTDIKKTIEGWLVNNVTKNSTVFIYYSGHGAPEPASGKSYIVPFDGDPNYLSTTSYPLKEMYEQLTKLQAAQIIIVLDACFSGAGGRSVLAKGARALVRMEKTIPTAGNLIVLSSTQEAQISSSSPEKKHGIFTYYFLEALNAGKKDLAEIYLYIKPKIENEAHKLNVEQSPSLSIKPNKIKGKYKLW